jgi:glucose/arabinose dehydrogenase
MRLASAIIAAGVLLAACGAPAVENARADYGPNPTLAAPHSGILPTVHIATAVGWPQGGAPVAPAGFSVTRFAEGLDHPRMIYVLPDGGVLVAEATTQEESGGGFEGVVRNMIQRQAGATGPSPNRIMLLRDSNGDGRVDETTVFADGLNQPFGMAEIGRYFYVGNVDGVVRFPYTQGARSVEGDAQSVLRIPVYPNDNGHWTRNLLASVDGSKLYVAVGSSSNIADHGMEAEFHRANILEMNPDGTDLRVFASGIRNPVGLAWEPSTHALWAAVNERDMLGDQLVPDYITGVREGGFYGWPYSYYGRHLDDRVKPQRPDLVAQAIAPDYAMGAHTASLGLAFYTGSSFPEHYRGGAFVGQHGSWNRTAFVGYKVVFVPFADGRPRGEVEDFLTGFLNAKGQAQGRPVGVAVDHEGGLLVADDVGGIVWRVAANR